MEEIETIKIMLIGDEGIGKTSLLVFLLTGVFPHYTLGIVDDEHELTYWFEGQKFNLILCETKIDYGFEKARPFMYHLMDCFVFCYSVVCENSLKNISSKWIPDSASIKTVPAAVICGMKKDLAKQKSDLYLSPEFVKSTGSVGDCCLIEVSTMAEFNRTGESEGQISMLIDECIRQYLIYRNSQSKEGEEISVQPKHKQCILV